jgi:hypothetical protein
MKEKGYYKKETLKKLPRVHVTTVCDEHQFKSKAMSLDAVTEYCGAEYLGD